MPSLRDEFYDGFEVPELDKRLTPPKFEPPSLSDMGREDELKRGGAGSPTQAFRENRVGSRAGIVGGASDIYRRRQERQQRQAQATYEKTFNETLKALQGGVETAQRQMDAVPPQQPALDFGAVEGEGAFVPMGPSADGKPSLPGHETYTPPADEEQIGSGEAFMVGAGRHVGSAAGVGVGGWGGALVGQALIPIPVLGALIGGVAGSFGGGYIGEWLQGAVESDDFTKEQERKLALARQQHPLAAMSGEIAPEVLAMLAGNAAAGTKLLKAGKIAVDAAGAGKVLRSMGNVGKNVTAAREALDALNMASAGVKNAEIAVNAARGAQNIERAQAVLKAAQAAEKTAEATLASKLGAVGVKYGSSKMYSAWKWKASAALGNSGLSTSRKGNMSDYFMQELNTPCTRLMTESEADSWADQESGVMTGSLMRKAWSGVSDQWRGREIINRIPYARGWINGKFLAEMEDRRKRYAANDYFDANGTFDWKLKREDERKIIAARNRDLINASKAKSFCYSAGQLVGEQAAFWAEMGLAPTVIKMPALSSVKGVGGVAKYFVSSQLNGLIQAQFNPGGVAEAYARGKENRWMISDDEFGNLNLMVEQEAPSDIKALYRAWMKNNFEYMSEHGGETFNLVGVKVLGKMPGKLSTWLTRMIDDTADPTTFIHKLFKAGSVQPLGESLEERYNDLLNAVFRSNDDVDDKSFNESIVDAMLPGWRQVGVELAAFAVPGAMKVAAGHVLNKRWSDKSGPQQEQDGGNPAESDDEESSRSRVTQEEADAWKSRLTRILESSGLAEQAKAIRNATDPNDFLTAMSDAITGMIRNAFEGQLTDEQRSVLAGETDERRRLVLAAQMVAGYNELERGLLAASNILDDNSLPATMAQQAVEALTNLHEDWKAEIKAGMSPREQLSVVAASAYRDIANGTVDLADAKWGKAGLEAIASSIQDRTDRTIGQITISALVAQLNERERREYDALGSTQEKLDYLDSMLRGRGGQFGGVYAVASYVAKMSDDVAKSVPAKVVQASLENLRKQFPGAASVASKSGTEIEQLRGLVAAIEADEANKQMLEVFTEEAFTSESLKREEPAGPEINELGDLGLGETGEGVGQPAPEAGAQPGPGEGQQPGAQPGRQEGQQEGQQPGQPAPKSKRPLKDMRRGADSVYDGMFQADIRAEVEKRKAEIKAAGIELADDASVEEMRNALEAADIKRNGFIVGSKPIVAEKFMQTLRSRVLKALGRTGLLKDVKFANIYAPDGALVKGAYDAKSGILYLTGARDATTLAHEIRHILWRAAKTSKEMAPLYDSFKRIATNAPQSVKEEVAQNYPSLAEAVVDENGNVVGFEIRSGKEEEFLDEVFAHLGEEHGMMAFFSARSQEAETWWQSCLTAAKRLVDAAIRRWLPPKYHDVENGLIAIADDIFLNGTSYIDSLNDAAMRENPLDSDIDWRKVQVDETDENGNPLSDEDKMAIRQARMLERIHHLQDRITTRAAFENAVGGFDEVEAEQPFARDEKGAAVMEEARRAAEVLATSKFATPEEAARFREYYEGRSDDDAAAKGRSAAEERRERLAREAAARAAGVDSEGRSIAEEGIERRNREAPITTLGQNGRKGAVYLDRGEEEAARVVVEYHVVSADDIISSRKQGYLQPRNENINAGSEKQVDRMADRLNFDQVSESPNAQIGAPLVTLGGEVWGGNGRAMAIRQAYAKGSADAYQKALAQWAEDNGIDISGIEHPMLVRVTVDKGNLSWRDLANLSNAIQGNIQKASESAFADAQTLLESDSLIPRYSPGQSDTTVNSFITPIWAHKFAKAIGYNGEIVANGEITPDFEKRIERAFLVALLNSRGENADMWRTISALVEDEGEGVRNAVKALIASAPGLLGVAKNSNYASANILPQVAESLIALKQLREGETSVAEWKSQAQMLNEDGNKDLKDYQSTNDVVRMLVEWFGGPERRNAAGAVVGNTPTSEADNMLFLRTYIDSLKDRNSGNIFDGMGGEFTDYSDQGRVEVLRSVMEKVKEHWNLTKAPAAAEARCKWVDGIVSGNLSQGMLFQRASANKAKRDWSNEKPSDLRKELVRRGLSPVGSPAMLRKRLETDDARRVEFSMDKPTAKADKAPARSTPQSDERPYYAIPFEESLREVVKAGSNIRDNVFVRDTPNVMRNIGLPALPIMASPRHLRLNYYDENGFKKLFGQIRSGEHAHGLGVSLEALPKLLEEPLAILANHAQHARKGSIVVLTTRATQNGRVIIPVEISGTSSVNGEWIDAHHALTVFSHGNWVEKILKPAIAAEKKGIGVFYVDAEKIQKAAVRVVALRVLLPMAAKVEGGAMSGVVHTIDEPGSPVKGLFKGQEKTLQFKRWFGASRVVDESGEPLVVYRGSEYDPLAQEPGEGVVKPEAYFTADLEYAKRYARNGGVVRAYYIKMERPFDVRDPRDAARLLELRDGHDFARGQSGALDWAEAPAAEEIKKRWPGEYDGLILDEGADPAQSREASPRGLSFVPFDGGAQVKSATGNVGTFDPKNQDVRFSRGGVFDEPPAEEQAFNGRKAVERRKDLVAVHNVKASAIAEIAKLGGFAMPSIAVTKDSIPFGEFGDCTVLFGKEAIDPKKNRKNALYSHDAWTPTFPEVVNKIDMDAIWKVNGRILSTVPRSVQDAIGSDGYPLNYEDGIQEAFNHAADAADAYAGNPIMKAAYLVAKGEKVEPAMKARSYTGSLGIRAASLLGNEGVAEVHRRLGKRLMDAEDGPIEERKKEFDAILPELEEIMRDIAWERKVHASPALKESGLTKEKFGDIHFRDNHLSFSEITMISRTVFAYDRDLRAGVAGMDVVDTYETREAINARVDSNDAEYRAWINRQYGKPILGRFVWNGKQAFTPTGNRRSWDARHDEATLDNIVKAMRKTQRENGGGFLGRNPFGVAVRKFKSIGDVISNEKVIKAITPEQEKSIKEKLTSRLSALVAEYEKTNRHPDSNPFIAHDRAADMMFDAWEAAGGNFDRMKAELNSYGYSATDSMVRRIQKLFDDISMMPTNYFEAKPQRSVYFNEMQAWIVPDTLPEDARKVLEDNGQRIYTYKEGNAEDRMRVVNAAAEESDVKFSVSGVFTGSAADYDKPSLVKVGTGEGSQVYGWGLYASSERGVAERYKSIADKSHDAEILLAYYDSGKERGLTQQESFAELAERAKTSSHHRRAYKAIEGKVAGIKTREDVRRILRDKGYLYEQTFFTNRAPGDESHLLNWYEPVGEENMQRVFKRAKEEDVLTLIRAFFPYRTGQELYAGITSALGSPKAASEFLARADIDGIKYPVDSYGGKGVKDGDEAGWNYVSFRDDNIKVEHKWKDGAMVFQRRAEAKNWAAAKVPELRKELVRRGLSPAGTPGMLRERLEDDDRHILRFSMRKGISSPKRKQALRDEVDGYTKFVEEYRPLYADAVKNGTWKPALDFAEKHDMAIAGNVLMDYFEDPQFKSREISGLTVESPEDVAAVLMTVRSPFVESIKAIYLDKGNRIIDAKILAIGLPRQAALSRGAVTRHMPKGTAFVVLAHNHPSGNPSPSREDGLLTNVVSAEVEAAGAKIIDHIITDGDSFYSFNTKRSQKIDVATPKWEVVPAGSAKSDTLDTVAALRDYVAKHLRDDGKSAHIIYVNAQAKVVGVRRLPALANGEMVDQWAKQLAEGAEVSCSCGAFIDFGPAEIDASTMRIALQHVAGALMTKGVDVYDACHALPDGTVVSMRARSSAGEWRSMIPTGGQISAIPAQYAQWGSSEDNPKAAEDGVRAQRTDAVGGRLPAESPLEVHDLNGTHKVIRMSDVIAGKTLDELRRFLRQEKDSYVRLYHGTGADAVKTDGIRRTSAKTRRSVSSTPGYVYLAATPDVARRFGVFGHGNASVYAVDVKIRDLLPDNDSIFLARRDAGVEIARNGLAESLYYTGNARLKRDVFPYEMSPTRFQKVGYREDGVEVYKTPEHIRRMPLRQKQALIKKMMNEEYAGRTARLVKDGERIYAQFEQEDIQKNLYGDKRSDRPGQLAKLNVMSDDDGVFDLVENARYWRTSAESGKPSRAHQGVSSWDYFQKCVQIDGRVYDVVINVRNKDGGRYVYSTELKESRYKKPLPVVRKAEPEGQPSWEAATSGVEVAPHLGVEGSGSAGPYPTGSTAGVKGENAGAGPEFRQQRGEQVESATDNVRTFDPKDQDVRFSVATRKASPEALYRKLDYVRSSTSVSHLKADADYDHAKHGRDGEEDGESAARVVQRILKPAVVDELAGMLDTGRPVVILPLHNVEGASLNAIPKAYAEHLAKELSNREVGFDVAVSEAIAKVSREHNTGATQKDRASRDFEFEGELDLSGNPQIIIVDDVWTSGQTMISEVDYILSKHPDADIVSLSTLATGRYAKDIRPKQEKLDELCARCDTSLRQLKDEYGLDLRKATGSEIHGALLNAGVRSVSSLLERFGVFADGAGRDPSVLESRETGPGLHGREPGNLRGVPQEGDGLSGEEAAGGPEVRQQRAERRDWNGVKPSDLRRELVRRGLSPAGSPSMLRKRLEEDDSEKLDDAENGDVRFSVPGVFTGSAADYAQKRDDGRIENGPSLEKVGTGEGAQVYGWGLYGSRVRGVAETYSRATLQGSGLFLLDGKPLPDYSLHNPRTPLERMISAIVAADGDKIRARENLEANAYYLFGGENPKGMEALRYFDANKDRVTEKKPFVYEQTFFTNRAPGDESHLMLWYSSEGVKELRKKILENLPVDQAAEFRKAFNRHVHVGVGATAVWNKDVYGMLADILGSPKAASEFLRDKCDIDGIKYPVNSFGGKTIQDGNKAGWNYVSFRDDNIKVDHKWSDGEMVFQRGASDGKTDQFTGDGGEEGPSVRFEIRSDDVENKTAGYGSHAEGPSGTRPVSGGATSRTITRESAEPMVKFAGEIARNGAKRQEEFLLGLFKALGANEINPDKTKYFDIVQPDGRLLSLRLANHRASAGQYIKNGNTADEKVSVVVKMSEKRFYDDKNVVLTEFVYFSDKLTAETEAGIARGIAEWIHSGRYTGPKADQVNVSPSRRDGNAMFQRDEGGRLFPRQWQNARIDERTTAGGKKRYDVVDNTTGEVLESGLRSREAAIESIARGASRMDLLDGEMAKLGKADVDAIAKARKDLVESLARKQGTAEERVAKFNELCRSVGIHKELAEKEWQLAEKILSQPDTKGVDEAFENAERAVVTSLARASIRQCQQDIVQIAKDGKGVLRENNMRVNQLREVRDALAAIKTKSTPEEIAEKVNKLTDREQFLEDRVCSGMDEHENKLSYESVLKYEEELAQVKIDRIVAQNFEGLLSNHGGTNREKLRDDLSAWNKAKKELENLARGAKASILNDIESKRQRAKETRNALISDFTDGKGIPRAAQRQGAENAKGWRDKAKDWIRGIVAMHMSGGREWGEFLTKSHDTAFRDTRAGRFFHDGLSKAHSAETEANEQDQQRALRILSTVFGKNVGNFRELIDLSEVSGDLFRAHGFSKIKELKPGEIKLRAAVYEKSMYGSKRHRVGRYEEIPCNLTLGDLMSIVLYRRQAEAAAGQSFCDEPEQRKGIDATLMESLAASGYSKRTMDEIEKALDERGLVQLALAISADMETKSGALDDVMRKHFHSSLLHVPFYAPLKRVHYGADEKNEAKNGVGGFMGLARSFLKERIRNYREIQPVNLIESWQNHNRQANHLITHSDWVSEVGRVFRHVKMQEALEWTVGRQTRNYLNRWLDLQASGGTYAKVESPILDSLSRKFAAAVTCNPRIMIKQLTSGSMALSMLPDDASTARWAADMAYIAIPTHAKAFNDFLMKVSSDWRQRGEDSSDAQMLTNRHVAGSKLSLMNMKLNRALSTLTRFGDRGGAMLGCYGIYKAWERKLLSQGKSAEEAQAGALEHFVDAVNGGQQSALAEYMSYAQTTGRGFRFFYMFKTANAAMTKNFFLHAQALLKHRGSPKQHLRGMLGIWFSDILFKLAGSAFMPLLVMLGLAGDDDDEERKDKAEWQTAKAMMQSAIDAPLGGFLIGGDMVSAAGSWMLSKLGNKAGLENAPRSANLSENLLPSFTVFNDAVIGLGKLDKGDVKAAMDYAVRVCSETAGAPWFSVAYEAITDDLPDAISAEDLSPAERIARGLMFSRSAIGAKKAKKAEAKSVEQKPAVTNYYRPTRPANSRRDAFYGSIYGQW